jgi:hypothetical protein
VQSIKILKFLPFLPKITVRKHYFLLQGVSFKGELFPMSHKDTPLSEPKAKGYILIIDDDDHRRSTFASYLENFGYQVKMPVMEPKSSLF